MRSRRAGDFAGAGAFEVVPEEGKGKIGNEAVDQRDQDQDGGNRDDQTQLELALAARGGSGGQAVAGGGVSVTERAMSRSIQYKQLARAGEKHTRPKLYRQGPGLS